MRLLVVLGEGGHTTELLRLVDLLGDRYEYSYVLAKEDTLSASRIRCPGPIYRVTRPRGKHTGALGALCKTVLAGLESIRMFWQIRPAAVVSTGPALAVPVAIVGRLFGSRIIYIETGSRVRTLSMTGRIMYRLADVFFVQWPQLTEQLPRAIYAGRLL